MGSRRLPMVGPATRGTRRKAAFVEEASPERIRDGWEHRFVAAGARADEMVALYRELGFEVVADPVPTRALEEGCAGCFEGGGQEYRSIYTRQPDRGSPREEGMSENHPTRVLRDEHRHILAVADVLEGLLADDSRAPKASEDRVDFHRLGQCIRFVRLFADACHHGKEEDLLFPALQAQGLPRDSGPIAVMLHEHRLGRRFASTMADNLDAAREGDAAAWSRLRKAGRDYVGLIRGHILKEDNVLFGMADQLVSGPACTRLCAAYDGTADHTFDGCTKAELEALGREIVGEV